MLTIKRSREPLQEQDITRVEAELGYSLPPQYRRFLLQHNGGRPHPDAFLIADNPVDDHGLVDMFLCVKPGDLYHIVAWAARYRSRIPAELLPIAVDPGGNLICLATQGERTGKVYFWDHEEETPEGNDPGTDNIYVIAGSFDSFLASLTDL